MVTETTNAPERPEERVAIPDGALRVRRLALRGFRTYPALDLAVERQLVALAGHNGAGKTNLLEALSLFSPGRGLRRAELSQMARPENPGAFTVAVTLDSAFGEHQLGTALSPDPATGRASRSCRIDGAAAGSPSAFAEHVRVLWLTPELDGLFRGSPGERRRFLDRLVLAVDASHGARVNALERALRSRNRLLEEAFGDRAWLDGIEREVAELGIAVTAARRETVERLGALILASRDAVPAFPFSRLALAGEIDELVATLPAVDAEDRYRAMLRDGRSRDRAAGRTLIGPQASDLLVRHGPKDIPSESCSTGEQKALLVGLILAHARLVETMSGLAPIVLMDEIAAHLDPYRRSALFTALAALPGQVWMTGADPALFAELQDRADRLWVTPGRVEPLKA